MGRPKKYHSDADRLDAARLAADVIHEIKATSGLTYVELSAFFEKHKIIIGADMLRQHACGKKPIGARLLTEIAAVAISEKLAGDKCWEAFLFHNYDHVKNINAISNDFERYRLISEKRLSLCVNELVGCGVSYTEVMRLVDDSFRLANETLSYC